jgi:hypothetical protein
MPRHPKAGRMPTTMETYDVAPLDAGSVGE